MSLRHTLSFLCIALLVSGVPAVQTVQAQGGAVVTDYADLVERLSPAVVNISTQTKPRRAETRRIEPFGGENPFEGTPFEDFFQQFQEGFPQGLGDSMTQPRQSLGTGVIISADGFIITNNHVIEGADEIVVKLSNSRHDFPARVVGRDEKTDLALLKINATTQLPVVKMGESSSLRVGQAVLAIGNPFGLGGTVTSGIVSALARNIGQGPYDDFIQTDVAINPGNSGGPLFNVQGEVVGINTAIFSRTGGSNGISFAIPSDVVKDVVAQLQKNGRVARGYMGVKVQALTKDLAEGLGIKDDVGALVAEVTESSPAEKAGVRQGDVILRFNNKPVDEVNDLPKLVAAMPVGTRAPLQVLRNGKPLTLTVVVAALEADAPETSPTMENEEKTSMAEQIGLVVSNLPPSVRLQRQIPNAVTGLLVVRANGAAQEAGLRVGDVIAEADMRKVTSAQSLQTAMVKQAGKALLLRVWRPDGYLFISVDVPVAR